MKAIGQADIARVVWQVRKTLNLLGWPGVLGVSLITFSLLASPIFLLPVWLEARDVQVQASLLRESAAQRGDVRRRTDPAAQLAEFYRIFPGTDSITETLDRIYQAAAENHIILSQGDYSLASAESQALQRYEVNLPVRGKYAQVRNFIAKVLAENSNAALLSITMTRNNATDIGVDAQVRFALYLRDTP